MGFGYTEEERRQVIVEEKAKIEQERSVNKREMDQREAMIAAIRAQVEKEKAEKEAKLQQQEQLGAASSAASGNAKPQFKTLSQEDLQRLEEKKRRKQAGEPVDAEPVQAAESSEKAPEAEAEKASDKAPETEPVSSAGLGADAGVGLDQSAGATLSSVATEGGSLNAAPAGESLAGGLGGGLGAEPEGGLNISGLDTPVTSIQEDSFTSSETNAQDSAWVASSTATEIPTIETPAAPQKNLDEAGNLISVVPIKQDSQTQDVKSLYNIDFDDDEDSAPSQDSAGAAEAEAKAAEEAARAEAEAKAAEEAARAEAEAKAAEEAKKKAAEEAARAAAETKATEEAARKEAIAATRKADEEARKAAERAARKAEEDATIKKAKEEAAKRRAAEEAKKKAAEEAARASYANEVQSKVNTANRRLDAAAQRVIEANSKVAALDDQEKNHAKYVEEALAKIDAETENKVLQVKDAETGRVQAVADSFVKKREDLEADFAAKEEEAKRAVEEAKKAKADELDQIKQSQQDRKNALEKENQNQKVALQQEEQDKKRALSEEEGQAKADAEKAGEQERKQLDDSFQQEAQSALDELAGIKAQVEAADGKIQAASDHVAELERQLEAAKQAVEQERQNKIQAESQIPVKEAAVEAYKADAEAKKAELDKSIQDKVQKIEADYAAKQEALVNEYAAKQNHLVEDYKSQCVSIDSETESLLDKTEREIARIDVKEEADQLNRQAGLEERKQALGQEEADEVAKAKEQTQSEIDACRAQGEQEKTAYMAKSNDEVESVRIQLKKAKDEAASVMQVYEITRRSALEALEAAKRFGIEASMPALEIEIPKGAVKTASPGSVASASASKSAASTSSQKPAAGDSSESGIPISVMEFMSKYLESAAIAASVRGALTGILSNPTGNKNILVLGKHGFGSTVVGNDFARAYYAAGICSSKTIANIKAAALNKRPLESVKDKLKGGCLVVENAGALTKDRLQEISAIGKDASNDITIILTGEKDRTTQAINEAGISDLFANTISMTDVDDAGMFAIGKAYTKQLAYAMDSAAESVLKNKLKEIEDGNLDRYLKLVDDAVEKAKAQGENGHLAAIDFK